MATRKLTKAPRPDVISSRRAAQLASEWAKLEDERLELERLARTKGKMQEAIEAQLLLFVDAEKKGPTRLVELSKFVLEIELRDGTLYYKSELERLMGPEAFAAKIAMLPKRDKLVVKRK